eukprot:Colp12_sorted_trinity150504_noHs@23164
MAETLSSHCKGFVDSILPEKRQEHVGAIIALVNDGIVTLQKLVEVLGIYLINTDGSVRSRSTLLLAETLDGTNVALKPAEVDLFVSFFIDRIQDGPSLGDALVGVLAIAKRQQLRNDHVTRIALAIFNEVHVQSQPQPIRYTVFQILSALMSKYREALRSMGSDFVFGFIQSMDAEKDPRNLVAIFEMIPIIIAEFTYSMFTDDLFEVISCYFPVTFNPGPNDPYGITREELVDGLRTCLTATPAFAEFLIPLLLEKISSTIKDTKLEAMRTMATAVATYPASAVQNQLDAIYPALRKEIQEGSDDDIKKGAIKALAAVVQALHNGVGATTASAHSFVQQILLESTVHFTAEDLKEAIPGAQVLQVRACKPKRNGCLDQRKLRQLFLIIKRQGAGLMYAYTCNCAHAHMYTMHMHCTH